MNLAIYDDNAYDIAELSNCIDSYFKKYDMEYHLDICKTTAQLLDNIYHYDIVFLDMEINDENGIDIGMKLRDETLKTIIIIVSKSGQYSIEGYKIRADRYFVKPIIQEDFHKEMHSVIQKRCEYYIDVNLKYNKPEKIILNQILFIEIDDRKTCINFVNGNKKETSLSINEWNEILHKYHFGQPHKSYIVNFNHICEYSGKNIILVNGFSITVTRHFKETFELKYKESLHKFI